MQLLYLGECLRALQTWHKTKSAMWYLQLGQFLCLLLGLNSFWHASQTLSILKIIPKVGNIRQLHQKCIDTN